MITTHIDAKPLKPSMMLNALATPVTTNTVTSNAPSGKATTQSRPGMSVRVITACTSQTASAAETAAKNSLRRGLCVLVRSSAIPAPNAGIALARNSTTQNASPGSRQASTAAPASTPEHDAQATDARHRAGVKLLRARQVVIAGQPLQGLGMAHDPQRHQKRNGERRYQQQHRTEFSQPRPEIERRAPARIAGRCSAQRPGARPVPARRAASMQPGPQREPS